ncbi:DUF465 domain-containing protein [Phenylobacterium sp.]|uniref:DUF465 domain-containing protein n=1 Tax=Phenylobacterium sp. TaxID=1871053 RepID=UPI003983A4FB
MKHHLVHRLRVEHTQLEAAIVEENRRPAPDEARLRGLKFRKLSVKDQLWAAELGLLLVPAR